MHLGVNRNKRSKEIFEEIGYNKKKKL